MKKVVVGSLLGLILLIGGAVAAVALNLDPLINEQRDRVAQIVTETIGRQVSFGPLKTTWSGGLGADITDVKLAAKDPQAPAQVTFDRIHLEVNLWKALTSLGKQLEVDAFVVEHPVVRLTRDQDGRWNFEDIPEHIKTTTPPEEPKPDEPEEPTDKEALKGLRIAGVAINNGVIEIDDRMLNRKLVIDALDLKLSPIQPGKDVSVALRLTLDDGKSKAPFSVDTSMKPLPADLDFTVLPATDTVVKLASLDLAPWASLGPKDAMLPSSGALTIDLAASTNKGAEKAQAKGFVELKGLVLTQKKASGQSSDVRLDVDVDANLKNFRVDVNQLDVAAPSVKLETRVSLVDKSVAGIKNANVELRVADLKRLIAILPANSTLLPKELTLAGPFAVDVKGDAEKGTVRVDLDKAHLAWADVMNKTAGTPLHLSLVANRAGDRIKVKDLELVLDNARLAGEADVSTKKGDPLTAKLDTGPIVLAKMKGIFPPFAKAIENKMKVDGTVRLEATAKAQGESQEVHARLSLAGMDVNLEGTTVKGDALISADVAPSGGITNAALVANLDGLLVQQRGADKTPVFNKPMGFRTGIDVAVVHSGQDLDVKKAEVALGKTLVQARGKVEGLDKKSPKLDVKVDKLDVAFDDLRTVSGEAKKYLPAGGRLGASITFAGDPGALSTVNLAVDGLELTASKNRVAGNIKVHNLDEPQVDVKLGTVDLDFDELRKLASSNDIPKGGYLRCKVDVTGNVKKLSTMDIKIEDLETSAFKSRFEGHVRLKDIDRPTFDIKVHGDKVDVNEILAQTSKPGKKEEAKEESKPENAHGLPKETRDLLKKVSGRADLAVGRVVYDDYTFDNFVGIIDMKNGVITFEKLGLRTFGGEIVADSTSIDTSEEYLKSKLALKVKGLDVAQVAARSSKGKDAFGGRLNAAIDVSTRGMTKDDILGSIAGPVSIASDDVTVRSINLLSAISGPIADMVPLAGKLKGKGADPKAGTQLRDVVADARLESGRILLQKPMTAKTPFGALSLEGMANMKKDLNLVGAAEITPDTVAQMTGGKFKPKKSVKTPVKIGGTWDKPVIEGVDVSSFIDGAGLGEFVGAAKAAAEEAKKKLEEQAAKAKEEAERFKKDAEDRAKAAADDARKKAEETRRRAEDEARKKADEARRRLEDEKKKREAEARKKADDVKKKAEDEAKRKAEEAKNALKNIFK